MVVPLLRSRLRERYLWPQMEIPWTQLGRFDRNQMSVLHPFAVREQGTCYVRWVPGSGVQCTKVEQDMTERYYFETRSDYPNGVNKRVSTLHNFEQRLRQKAIEIRQRDADDLQLPHSPLPSRCSIAASQPTWKSPQFAIHDITPTHVGKNNEVSTG